MTLTHLNCHLYRSAAEAEDKSSYVAVSPINQPGTFLFAGSTAARHSLGSQVAFKLALEHFLEAGLDFFTTDHVARNPEDPSEETLQMLEAAFRQANNSVYQFGHRLAAGGRLAASLLGIVIERDFVAAGRVGNGSAYLYRRGELFPFFEQPKEDEQFIGAHSVVSVELASVPLEEHDLVLVFSRPLAPSDESRLVALLGSEQEDRRTAVLLSRVERELSFGVLAEIGPQTIYLTEVAT